MTRDQLLFVAYFGMMGACAFNTLVCDSVVAGIAVIFAVGVLAHRVGA